MTKQLAIRIATAVALITFLLLVVPWRVLTVSKILLALSSPAIIAIVLVLFVWMLIVIPPLHARVFHKSGSPVPNDESKVNVENAASASQGQIKPIDLFTMENESRKTLAQILGGFLVIVGLILTWLHNANTSNLTQEGQLTDRFTKAISQLGDKDKLEVRLGGIYALERIAKDSEKDYWTIMEVLTAFVRENASLKKQTSLETAASQPSSSDREERLRKPTTDIQAILTIIARRERRNEDYRLDLSNTSLQWANLENANLHYADFSSTSLRYADLGGANLSWAILDSANLEEARLGEVNFTRALVSGSNLRGASITGANLSNARFNNTDLQGSYFNLSDLKETSLYNANLKGADLSETKNLTWEQLKDSIIDDLTRLPPEIEIQHSEELKEMRKNTREGKERKQ